MEEVTNYLFSVFSIVRGIVKRVYRNGIIYYKYVFESGSDII
jgi:hypothetical protein